MPLTPPERTGRTVASVPIVLERSDARLRLAWKLRDILNPALPGGEAFHPRAWTAFSVLQSGRATSTEVSATSVRTRIEVLRENVSLLRNIVSFTTRPEHPARVAMQMSKRVLPTRDLIELAPAIIAGAKKWQATFPALTNERIHNAEQSLAQAVAAVKDDTEAQTQQAAQSMDQADPRQLALDVLLDCIDHLRAAALATLMDSRPKLAQALMGPLEPEARRNSEEDDPEPTPDPTPKP